jgi:hypothetical protein
LDQCLLERQFWFDTLDEVLEQISNLSQHYVEAVQLRDWTALVRLPPSRSPIDVQELFYPHAPADILDNLELNGHSHRRVNFLVALEHSSYHRAYQYVLEHPE